MITNAHNPYGTVETISVNGTPLGGATNIHMLYEYSRRAPKRLLLHGGLEKVGTEFYMWTRTINYKGKCHEGSARMCYSGLTHFRYTHMK